MERRKKKKNENRERESCFFIEKNYFRFSPFAFEPFL